MLYDKICIAKTAWSEDYQGAPIFGRHEHVQRTRDGHERFNFLPGPDGRFYVYLPPVAGEHRIPDPDSGWLILIVAAETFNNGRSFGPLKVIGWLENARFVKHAIRPEYSGDLEFDKSKGGDEYSYNVVAEEAFLIPVGERSAGLPKEHGRKIGTASMSFLRGPNVVNPEIWKNDYSKFIEAFVEGNRSSLVSAAASAENGSSNYFATKEHRLRVEKAAEKIAKEHFKGNYKIQDVTKENRGYDFHLTHKVDGSEVLLEVKGTAASNQAFFFTRNEHRKMKKSPRFRVFLATSVLSEEPKIVVLDRSDLEENFQFQPLVYRVEPKP